MRVRFLGPDTDAYVASVERHAPEFEERTGLELDVRIVPSDLYFSNGIHHLLDGDGAADVYMSGPVLCGSTSPPVSSGRSTISSTGRATGATPATSSTAPRLQPLDGPLRRPARRRAAARGPGQLRVVQPRVRPGGSRRGGRRRARRPGTSTSTSARDDRERRRRVPRLRPARDCGVAHDVHGFATQFWSCGGRDFEGGSLRDRLAGAVRVTGEFVAALPRRRPDRLADQRWYELALDFARGRYGLIVDSDHYVAYFEDPKTVSPSPGRSRTRCRRSARTARVARTCGRGRWW